MMRCYQPSSHFNHGSSQPTSAPTSPRKRAFKRAPAMPASARSVSPRASCSNSPQPRATTTATTRSLYFPLTLPKPLITIISDPWANYEAHLCGHGMLKEAGDVGRATPDWVLSQLPAALHDETVALRATLRSRVDLGGEVPSFVDVPAEEARGVTHLLALADTAAAATPELRKRGMLLPIHGLIYASSLVSLPSLGASAAYNDEDEGSKTATTRLPVVKVSVPAPESFGAVHRWVYTRCPTTLLAELLPLRFISRAWPSYKPDSKGAKEMLSCLPCSMLVDQVRIIQHTWSNAVAVGLTDGHFWTVLNKAYDLVIGALAIQRAKRLDAELAAGVGKVNIQASL